MDKYIIYSKTNGVLLGMDLDLKSDPHPSSLITDKEDQLYIPVTGNEMDEHDIDDREYWKGRADEIIKHGYPLDYVKSMKKLEIAKLRYQNEISGVTIEQFGGITIDTDLISQSKIMGAALEAIDDPGYICNWKCKDGNFIALSADTIKFIARTVRTHVQKCYDMERKLNLLVDSLESVADIEQVSWDSDVSMIE